MTALYGIVLVVLFACPSAAALSRTLYPTMSTMRFLAFFASILVYLAYGRYLKHHARPRLLRGAALGAVTAFFGTLLYQYIIRLPLAQTVLIPLLPGVPSHATLIMLHLHQKTGALLSGVVAGGLNACLGAVATSRARFNSPPHATNGSPGDGLELLTEDPST